MKKLGPTEYFGLLALVQHIRIASSKKDRHFLIISACLPAKNGIKCLETEMGREEGGGR